MRTLLLASAAAALAATSASAQNVRVGSVAGVTGPIAELVEPIVAGRNLAAQHVNEQGGILGGRTFELVLADSMCDPSGGLDAGGRVVNVEQVVAIVGASCSGATNAMVSSVTIDAGVTIVSDSATAPSISELEDNDTVFRVAPSDAYQGAALAQLAIDAGYTSVAVTFANDDYNAGIAAVFVESFQALGGTITSNLSHEPNRASYRGEMATLSTGAPQAIAIFAYYGSSGITIIRNSLETASFDQFLAADGMFDASVIEQIGAENLDNDRIRITQTASDPAAASYQAFADLFTASGYDPLAPYASNGYDAAFLIALAIEKSGGTDRAAISAALRDVASPPGEVIRPGEWEKAVALIAAGEDINYEGASGSVDFDENGDVPGLYSVNTVNAEGGFDFELIGQ